MLKEFNKSDEKIEVISSVKDKIEFTTKTMKNREKIFVKKLKITAYSAPCHTKGTYI